MQRFLLFLFVSTILFSCGSSKKALQFEDYDKAIDKAAKALRRKPTNEKQREIIVEAYRLANMQDNDRLNYLKREGQPDRWLEMYRVYTRMSNRQSKLERLPSAVGLDLQHVNYDPDIIASKKNAAEYLYSHAQQLMNKGDKHSARAAHRELNELNRLYSNFKDVNQLMNQARFMGTNFVHLFMENETDILLPERFAEELLKIHVHELNKNWVEYHTQLDTNINYAYTIRVALNMIDVSPEKDKEILYTESREVQDGFRYVLDENGNVAKDTAGNDIKEPNMIVIQANVREILQTKAAIVGGKIEYYNNQTGQAMSSTPVNTEVIWEHRSAVANGDLNALKPETAKKLRFKPVAYPTDFALLMDAAEKLKDRVKSIVWNKNSLVSN